MTQPEQTLRAGGLGLFQLGGNLVGRRRSVDVPEAILIPQVEPLRRRDHSDRHRRVD